MMTSQNPHEVVDAHHHLWPAEVVPRQAWQPPEQSTLRRAFEPADLREDLRNAAVDGTVLMQSVDAPDENERLLTYAREAFVWGVVAWAPLRVPAAVPDLVEELLERSADPRTAPVVGVRCLVGTEPMAWALEESALETFEWLASRSLVWDVVPITAEQRDVVVQVARAVPSLRIVVDHLGSPPLGEQHRRAWIEGLARLEECPRVAIKLSVGVAVLAASEEWPGSLLTSWVADALDVFGPERAMAASNWPVVLLRSTYSEAWSDTIAAVRRVLPEAEAHAVLGGTARRWYGLEGEA
jgi:L-fuconolactonase